MTLTDCSADRSAFSDHAELGATIQQTISQLANYIMSCVEQRRSDRLCPTDVLAFQTNALGLAYGASGIAIFLRAALGECPRSVIEWISDRAFIAGQLPPGLYSGLAGVAWCLNECGEQAACEELMRRIPDAELAYAGADIFDGMAGWGYAALSLYRQTRKRAYLDIARLAGDRLVCESRGSDRGCHWTQTGTPVRLGFAYGSAGVGMFLLQLSKTLADDSLAQLAIRALEHDLSYAQVRGEALVWGATDDDIGHRPYWLRGGAGIVAALVRFSTLLGDKRYEDLALRAAEGCSAFMASGPHAFEGIAAMGNAMLDMHQHIGNSIYLARAWQKAEQIMLFKISTPEGCAFPGRFLFRISNDLGMGGAGIGLYLHRLLHNGRFLLHDI